MERFQADRAGTSREVGAEALTREPVLAGPYVLLAEIGRGELASVHLAKKESALGFQRLYALKRLKPALSGSVEHVELLLDEARLMSSIRDANIANVLDVGTDVGSYVVMEYVEGENLESLLGRAGAARQPRYVVPPLVDALHGLHALHAATGAAGEPGGIVHQAPRARHVLVGVDGSARLIDFSQVRAPGVRPSRCRSDRLKVAFMAPEMALHPDGVDLRADLFVVGITLWESLTGERLFAGDNDEQTFQNMLHRRVPLPSEVGLKPPRCFDAICMRALERDRAKRYGSALEMARDLREVALNEALYASSAELGHWVRELAGEELRERRRSAGMDAPSSAGMSLETPARGFTRAAPGQAEQAGPAAAHAAGASTAGAAHAASEGSSTGAHVLLLGDLRCENDDAALTPPVGIRRAPLPRAEAADDEPTGRRSSLPAAARPGPGSGPSPLPRDEDLGRAVTLPMVAQAIPSGVRSMTELGASLRPPASDSIPDAGDDREQTQPGRFVPARPGARRDARTVSPGAYSQVDARRRSAPAPERGAGVTFDELATGSHPGLASRAERAAAGTERSSAPAPGSERSRVSSLPARRPITETPPTYVQRRDSNPTRMQLPDGPVGAPHRSFPQDDANSDVHRMPVHVLAPPQDEPDVSAPAREPNPDEAREQSQPRVRRAELAGLQLGLIDSLSPPTGASLTAPPEPREAAGRSWSLWLASGVLAAIILLAVGVGIRQWIAGPSRPLPSTRHAAHGGESAFEPALRGPAEHSAQPAEHPAAAPSGAAPSGVAPSGAAPSGAAPSGAAPSEAAPSGAAPSSAAPSGAAPSGAAPSTAVRVGSVSPAAAASAPRAPHKPQTRVVAKPAPAARRPALRAPEPLVKRPLPAKPTVAAPPAEELPENPY